METMQKAVLIVDSECKALFAQLSEYLDEQLDDSLCYELEKHLDGCEPCKMFLASLERSIQQCRMAPNESPDPRVAAKLRRDLVSEYQGLMTRINAPHFINPSKVDSHSRGTFHRGLLIENNIAAHAVP
jgi:hypothetical protein